MSLKRFFFTQVCEHVRSHGFECPQLNGFVRQAQTLEQWWFVGPTKTKGGYRVTGGAFGVKLPEAEKILSHVRQAPYTVAMPVHLIKPARRYEDWIVTSNDEVASILPTILGDFEEYGLPFLGKWDSQERIKQALQSEDPKDWFMHDPDSRNALLVTFAYLERGPHGAAELGATLLQELGDVAPVQSVDLRKTLEVVQKQASRI